MHGCSSLGFRSGLIAILPLGPLTLTGDPTRFEPIGIDPITEAARSTEPGAASRWNRGGRAVNWRRGSAIMGAASPPRCGLASSTRSSRSSVASIAPREGTGIGPALVWKLAGLHGGTVEAYSEGSGRVGELIVRLPAPADRNENGYEVRLPRSRSA